MSTRRSLFVVGCLMAALVAFAPDAAFAQATDLTDLAAAARSHDTIRLTWTNDNANLDKFSLRYQASTLTNGDATDFDTTMNISRMDIKKSTSSTSYSYMVENLKPATRYVFELTPLGEGTNTDGAADYADGTTHTADAPDDVMNLMLTPGNRMIMATWDETTDNGSPVTGYAVQYREKGKTAWMDSRMGSTMDTSTEWTLSNLMNDMTYEVRVQACSFDMCGDWTDEEEAKPTAGVTPTPALPIFGAFALGAGLLAAGRARLRRREQRQLTR